MKNKDEEYSDIKAFYDNKITQISHIFSDEKANIINSYEIQIEK
jgi:hypothetical protein